jgi:hypothetical protein
LVLYSSKKAAFGSCGRLVKFFSVSDYGHPSRLACCAAGRLSLLDGGKVAPQLAADNKSRRSDHSRAHRSRTGVSDKLSESWVAAVSFEAVDVNPEQLAALPEVGIVEPALIGKE